MRDQLDDTSPFVADWRTIISLCVIVLVGAVASAAGVGGGAIFIPLLNALVGFNLKSSTSLSQACITCGAAASLVVNLLRPHPSDPGAALVDFSLAAVLTPTLLIGVGAGVLLNVMLPSWLLTGMLLLLLSLLIVQSVHKPSGSPSWLAAAAPLFALAAAPWQAFSELGAVEEHRQRRQWRQRRQRRQQETDSEGGASVGGARRSGSLHATPRRSGSLHSTPRSPTAAQRRRSCGHVAVLVARSRQYDVAEEAAAGGGVSRDDCSGALSVCGGGSDGGCSWRPPPLMASQEHPNGLQQPHPPQWAPDSHRQLPPATQSTPALNPPRVLGGLIAGTGALDDDCGATNGAAPGTGGAELQGGSPQLHPGWEGGVAPEPGGGSGSTALVLPSLLQWGTPERREGGRPARQDSSPALAPQPPPPALAASADVGGEPHGGVFVDWVAPGAGPFLSGNKHGSAARAASGADEAAAPLLPRCHSGAGGGGGTDHSGGESSDHSGGTSRRPRKACRARVGAARGAGTSAAWRRIPPAPVAALVVAWGVLFGLQVLRSRVPRCGRLWWSLAGVQTLAMAALSGTALAIAAAAAVRRTAAAAAARTPPATPTGEAEAALEAAAEVAAAEASCYGPDEVPHRAGDRKAQLEAAADQLRQQDQHRQTRVATGSEAPPAAVETHLHLQLALVLRAPVVVLGATCCAGLAGGLLGLGGGIVMGPLLLHMGLQPQVTAATSGAMVLFSSSAALAQFALMGRLNVQYAAVFGVASAAASVVGGHVLGRLVRRSGRPSVVVLALAAVMALGCSCVAVFGVQAALEDMRRGDAGPGGMAALCG